MHDVGGIGLAAQQVGVARQLCVVDLRQSDDGFAWELDGPPSGPRAVFMLLILANPARDARWPAPPDVVA